MGRKELDITNKRFGRLIALYRVESPNRDTRWRFRCDCGCEFNTKKMDVVYGRTRSCGCLRAEMMRERGKSNKRK